MDRSLIFYCGSLGFSEFHSLSSRLKAVGACTGEFICSLYDMLLNLIWVFIMPLMSRPQVSGNHFKLV